MRDYIDSLGPHIPEVRVDLDLRVCDRTPVTERDRKDGTKGVTTEFDRGRDGTGDLYDHNTG